MGVDTVEVEDEVLCSFESVRKTLSTLAMNKQQSERCVKDGEKRRNITCEILMFPQTNNWEEPREASSRDLFCPFEEDIRFFRICILRMTSAVA